jgi:uncharacterized membrane protein YfcA
MEIVELALAGAFIGLMLGVLGAGGAIFTAPLLMFVFDVPPREATTVSLVVVLLAAASGLVGHRGSRTVQWREGAIFGAVGTVAAAAGSWLATVLPDRVLTAGFSLLLLVAALAMVRQPKASDVRGPRKSLLVVAAAALGVGLVTGFFGVGGGFVIVPALVLVLGFGIREATATGLLVIAVNATAALAVRGPEYLDWAIALPMALGAAAGSFGGARIAHRLPRERLRQAFAAVMVGAALLLGLQTALS